MRNRYTGRGIPAVALTAVLVLGTAVAPVRAAEQAGLPELVDLALRENPELRQYENRHEAARENVTVAGSWDYPQAGVAKTGDRTMYSVSQHIPFPGKTGLREDAAAREADALKEESRAKRREIAAAVRKEYWEYWRAYETERSWREAADLLRRYLDVTQARYAAGKARQADVVKAHAELADTGNMLAESGRDVRAAQARLNALLGRAATTPVAAPARPEIRDSSPAYEEIEQAALATSPELGARSMLVEKRIAEERLARREWLPDVTAGVETAGDGSETKYSARLSVPLFYGRHKARTARREKEKAAAEAAFDAARDGITGHLKDAWERYLTAADVLERYRTEVLPLARQARDLSDAGYRAGKGSFLELADSQRRYLEYRAGSYRAEAERGALAAELERISGVRFYGGEGESE